MVMSGLLGVVPLVAPFASFGFCSSNFGFSFSSSFDSDVLLCGRGFSCLGDGGGGGILVPSVNDPNFKSKAGSSNRVGVGADCVEATPFLELFEGMTETLEASGTGL